MTAAQRSMLGRGRLKRKGKWTMPAGLQEKEKRGAIAWTSSLGER